MNHSLLVFFYTAVAVGGAAVDADVVLEYSYIDVYPTFVWGFNKNKNHRMYTWCRYMTVKGSCKRLIWVKDESIYYINVFFTKIEL